MDAAATYVLLLGACLASEVAKLDVSVYSANSAGEHVVQREASARGHFSAAGSASEIEGNLLQVHPLGLCGSADKDDIYKYGWIGVVHVEPRSLAFEPAQCRPLRNKARRALQTGAVGIVFIVYDNEDAAKELEGMQLTERLNRPIVLVHDKAEADKLLKVTTKSRHYSRIRISHETTNDSRLVEPRANAFGALQESLLAYINMAMLTGSLLIICIILIVAALQFRAEHQLKEAYVALRKSQHQLLTSGPPDTERFSNRVSECCSVGLATNNCHMMKPESRA